VNYKYISQEYSFNGINIYYYYYNNTGLTFLIPAYPGCPGKEDYTCVVVVVVVVSME